MELDTCRKCLADNVPEVEHKTDTHADGTPLYGYECMFCGHDWGWN